MATSRGGIEKKLVFFIYGQSSTIRANFVNIGPVDVEIIGLTDITKNVMKKIKQQRNIYIGWSDVISIPAGFRCHFVGKTLGNVFTVISLKYALLAS